MYCVFLNAVYDLLLQYWWILFVMTIGTVASVFAKKLQIAQNILYKVDKASLRNGGDLVADVLKAHDVKFLFTLTGGHISPILVAAEREGIRVVDTRHEASAVFAADAVARLCGNIGVAAVTAGPGLTNTVTAVKNAQMAESPVLLLGGAAATAVQGRGALQDIDQLSLFSSLCKYTATVKTVRDIIPTLRKAIQVAQSDTPGPVFVELPIDVLYPYPTVQTEVGFKGTPKGLAQKLVKWYLDFYLHNLFAGAFLPKDVSSLPVSVPLPKPAQVQRCAEILSKAKKPVIILGSQSTLPPTPVSKLQKDVERLGIPCFLGGMARGLLGRNSRLQMRHCRRDALAEADVVILAGAVCDFRLSYGRVLSRKSRIIAVNRNKDQLYKNSDAFWKPTVAIQADVASFISALVDALPAYSCDESWLETLRNKDNVKETSNRSMAQLDVDQHLNPMKVLSDLEEVLPDNAILVADGGDFVATASYILRPSGPLHWLDPGAFGTLGVGGGFALGAKLCRPDAEVVIIYGDGSLGYSMLEFDTYTRHKLPVIAVVGNDACWMQISREQVKMFKSNVACDLAFLDYHKSVEGLGARGIIATAADKDNMKDIYTKARQLYAQGHSVLINCLIGKTSFREGSISV
ncbi:2-hydroxyacyl-CoA lyase 2-like [Ornithodoros turicata]|uniref:2-hydroxyacyl-CoA lyase 2-like n=1 Tax=Ornithodoros turicata TaxID=34597 RepID=UPI003138F2B4